MLLTLGKTTVDFDLDKTRAYYETHTVCDCCDDRNFQRFAKSRFPALDRFLSRFGVDISRPDETASVYLEDRKLIQYLFVAYTVVGQIQTQGQDIAPLDLDDPAIRVSINSDYYPNEQTGDYFTIVVTGIVMPWLLEGAYPDLPGNTGFISEGGEGAMRDKFELLTEKEAMWAGMLEQVLRDNGVPCVPIPVYGAGLALKSGMQERFKICVPADRMAQAKELLAELFPDDQR